MAANARRLQTAAPAPRPRRTVPVRVEENQRRKRNKQRMQTLRRAVMVGLVVVMAAALLFTQALITQTQNQLETQERVYKEQLAQYDDLMCRLEGMVDMRNLDEQARNLGLVPLQSNQIIYVSTDRPNMTQSAGSFLSWLENAWIVVRGMLEAWGL